MAHPLDTHFMNKSHTEQETTCDTLYKYSIENCDLEAIDYLIRTFPEHMFYNCIMYNDIELVKIMVLDYKLDYHKRNNLAIKQSVIHKHFEIFCFLIDNDATLYSDNRRDNRMIDEYLEKIGILSFQKINL